MVEHGEPWNRRSDFNCVSADFAPDCFQLNLSFLSSWASCSIAENVSNQGAERVGVRRLFESCRLTACLVRYKAQFDDVFDFESVSSSKGSSGLKSFFEPCRESDQSRG